MVRPTYFDKTKTASTEPPGQPVWSGNESAGLSLEPKLASALCYLPFIGWMAAVFMILTQKNSLVRFHALQALGFFFVWFVLVQSLLLPNLVLSGLSLGFYRFVSLWTTIGVIILLALAYQVFQGKKIELPILAKLAWSIEQAMA